MNKIEIDINADVGEGIGQESQIMPLLSSCSIACGGHTGDASSMRKAVLLALKNKVKIGAHPSYPDSVNFGRLSMVMSSENLKASIRSQLQGFVNILNKENAILHHIKPHGALYNDMASNLELATLFLEAIEPYKNKVKLYVPYASVSAKLALSNNFNIAYEVFLDRNYNADLTLVSRKQHNALLTDPQEVLDHLLQLVQKKQVQVTDGTTVHIKADTYCIHSDTSSALQILTYLHCELPNHNIVIKK